jgi:hypothetical protein
MQTRSVQTTFTLVPSGNGTAALRLMDRTYAVNANGEHATEGMTLQEALNGGGTNFGFMQNSVRVRPQHVHAATALRSMNLRQAQPAPQQTPVAPGRVLSPNSPLRNKIVYLLHCSACNEILCTRAMRAILLADTKVELYSTDIPPPRVHTCQQDQLTTGCNCRVRETVCRSCGQFVGYQVSQPCDTCLGAKNNGHFWMFTSDAVKSVERLDIAAPGKPLYWAALTPMAETLPVVHRARSIILLPLKDYEWTCR